VDRGGTGCGLDQGDASSSEAGLSSGAALTTLANVLDDGSFHSKLDEIEREEPDDIPDPNNSDPATGNGTDLGEAPVSVRGDNGRNKLATQKARNNATEGRSMKKNPWDRVTKMRA